MSDMSEKDESEEDGFEDNRTFVENGLYLPRLNLGPRVPHYYGDYVRKLFLAAAVAMFIFIPLFGVITPLLLPFQIFGALVFVTLAALTTPKKEVILIADALAAALGVVIFEAVALVSYTAGDILSFCGNQTLAVLLIFALYFSLKTVRAMELHQIGKQEPPGEFRKNWEQMSRWTRDPRNN